MMEQVDRSGQEEFIWAMRMRVAAATDDDTSVNWKDRKSSLDSTSTFHKSEESLSAMQCKILATLVPDEVIFEPNNYEPRNYEACAMYGQISGLNELYQEKTVGCSNMTQIINGYLGAMIQEILLFCGDVVKLSGDTILAMWKSGVDSQTMADCVHQAIDCALSIRKSCGSYETGLGVTLKVKIVIVCGEMIFKLLGNDERSHYIVYGSPILAINNMQGSLHGGDIALSKVACDYINLGEYTYELAEEMLYAKILDAGTSWRSSQRNFGRDDFTDVNFMVPTGNDANDQILVEFFDLRPALGVAIRLEMKDELRKFIPATLLTGIDLEEPIEYFTEMRNIVVTYIDIRIEKTNEVEYLDVVDCCYQHTERIVNEMDGSVNKVTLFTSNCRFLVIFGLRGFRHFLESKRALACAVKLDGTLRGLENVEAVTISITTGMTYCGAIGHTLRREYSVMSMGVNTAGLLTEAYPNKITCDKSTFLQSKLDPIQFVLQPPKATIQNGPIYQYVEDTNASMPHQAITQYPLLDRDTQLAVYTSMLETYIANQKNSTSNTDRLATEALVVNGRPKEGKTRLTEEYLFSTPNDIPMFRMKLIAADRHIPYQAIYFLFCVSLGVREYSSVWDRQTKLIAKLKSYNVPHLFCTLNSVFRVNFAKDSAYNSMTEHEKFRALNKMIKLLCYACFTMMWVIIIDGGENMDDESWSLMKTIIDSGRIFLVITVTNNYTLSPIAELVLGGKRVKSINLAPIDKWFHVGMACQFLNVAGIPAEVEKVLHNKSKGNPGWIESYLITLMHSGAMKIKSIPVMDAKQYGLVISPTEMIQRLSEYNLMATRTDTDLVRHNSKVFFNMLDKWRIYKYSFKDSTTDIKKQWRMDNSGTDSGMDMTKSDSSSPRMDENPHTIEICVIVDPNKIDDIDAESSIDSIVVKVLDYLSSYEQLLLKACSVIGQTLSRDMLHYIMDIVDYRQCAIAVKRLFELGVLGCARGKFSYLGSNAILNTPTISQSGGSLECRCEALKILECCQSLPRYASCGYLYFKIENFREMTYTLLTVFQRNEFHIRSIRYLEKKTRKCIKCGGGFFENIMGNDYSEMEKKKKKTASYSTFNTQFEKRPSMRKSLYEVASTTTSRDGTSVEGSMKSSLSRAVNGENIRSFTSFDFTNCECTRILFSMYKQLVEHTEAVGLMDKLLFANMEYGRLCIETCNIPLAVKVLNKTMAAFEENHHLIVDAGESWRVPFIKSKILVTLARARMETGQIHNAFVLFCEALAKLSFSLPKIDSLKYKILTLQQFMYLRYNKRYGLKVNVNAGDYCDSVAECLNFLCRLFIDMEMFRAAEVAALSSLKMVLKSERDFVTLLNSFSNIIRVYQLKRKTKYLSSLEAKALLYCTNYSATLDGKCLEAIANLYTILFKTRVWRCDLDNAVMIGNYLMKISNSLSTSLTNFEIYPLLVQVLLMTNRVTEAIMIFSTIEQVSLQDLDYYDLTWFYAMCVSFHLETGYVVIPFEECETYLYTEVKDFTSNREAAAQKRYYTVHWLWLLRNGRNEDADVWQGKINKTWQLTEYDKLVNLFTGLYYLEGLILQVVYKMDRINNLGLKDNCAEIDKMFSEMQLYTQHAIVIAPRLYHLRAFYLLTLQRDSEAYSMLAKAHRIAKQTGNIYEENWINHTEQAWKQDMSAIDYNFWRDHASSDVISFHLLENSDKFGFYTLEPPLYT